MPVAWIVAIAGLAWVPFWLGTLDRSLPGTDHALSVTPEELRQLVYDIRMVERLLGSSEKQPILSELQIRDAVRNRFPKVSSIRDAEDSCR
jgi:sialic acid synthase SpsE